MTKLNFTTKTAIALYAMLAAGVSSCNISSGETKNETPKNVSYEHTEGLWGSMDYQIEQKTIDSCEYIIIFGSEGRNIIHKANCRNTVHACR
jgi:hypothetical protein